MIEAVLILLAGGAAVYGLLHSLQKSDKRLRAWQDVARSCGLQVVEATSSAIHPRLEARAGPLEVRIKSGEKGRLTQIVVVGPAPPDFDHLEIHPERLFQLAREIEIGDPSFDSAFSIEGPSQLVFALLDAEARRLLSRLSAESARSRLGLCWGELRAAMADEKIADVLPLLLDLRKRFLPPIEVKQRLAENAMKDPKAGVRLQNLLLLVHEHSKAPETAEALRKACCDPVPRIRLQAARALGAEGRAVLLELTENLEDDAVSAEAVSALNRELPFERVKAILDLALRQRRLRTARACLEALGRSGAAAVGVLAQVLAKESRALAPVAAQALGATGSPAAEPPLIDALQDGDADLQLAAANALGRVGSVAAVLPLKKMAADFLLLGAVHRAARQAIAEIQSRIQGASPGQLSLAEAEAGQLSIADDPAGRLSIRGEDEAIP